ncbi:MAG: right-handed parallel beta-helix repeat-containing protein [Acidimicrobiia bacterium]
MGTQRRSRVAERALIAGAIVLGAVAGLVGTAAPAAAAGVTCGTTVTGDVVLADDLVCPGDGLLIGADNVTVDLGGHTLEGPGAAAVPAATGVAAQGHPAVVRNGRITGFATGVANHGTTVARGASVDGVTFEDNGTGVSGFHVGSATVSNSTFRANNVGIGCGEYVGSKDTYSRNTFSDNAFVGISLAKCAADVTSNRFTGNPSGITGSYAVSATITGNEISGSTQVGIALYSLSRLNLVQGNSIHDNQLGLLSSETDPRGGGYGNTISRNDVSRNGVAGLCIVGTKSVTTDLVADNTVSGNGFGPGPCTAGSTGPVVDDGIYVNIGTSPGVTLRNNLVTGNNDFGIEVVAGGADGGGNVGTGNGNPAQCLNVICADSANAVPGAPSNVVASAGDGTASVSWVAPTDPGQSPIDGYVVESSPVGRQATSAAGATTATVTGLANGTAYTFTVRAHNRFGYGVPSAASSAVTPTAPPVVEVHPESTARAGYWMLDAAGNVYGFGDAGDFGGAAKPMGPPAFGVAAVHIEPTPSGHGYWIVDTLGRVYAFGDATWHGNADRARFASGELVSSLSATPSGKGYWIFTSRGRVVPCGDAAAYGDVAAKHLNGPVLGSVATPSGRGYYMVASDGGIFAFGDATFYGSMGGKRLNAPVQSLVPTATGHGYWLVASDGGVFAFGDATFRGSMGGTHLNRPVVGMVRYGDGYLMVGADGGIFNFSDQPFAGSLGNHPPASRVTAVAALTG